MDTIYGMVYKLYMSIYENIKRMWIGMWGKIHVSFFFSFYVWKHFNYFKILYFITFYYLMYKSTFNYHVLNTNTSLN